MRKYFQISAILVSVAFIFFGMERGEVEIILQKAVHICLECIGLG